MQRGWDAEAVASGAIIIMGVSGSGKSTLGAILAQWLGTPFLEGDAFHSAESIATMRAGTPLSDDERWPWLDRLGEAVAGAVAREGGAVVACSALKRAYRDRLMRATSTATRFVLPAVGQDELERRLSARADHYMPASLILSQLETLEMPGADEHALIIDGLRAPEMLCQEICEWLGGARTSVREHGHGDGPTETPDATAPGSAFGHQSLTTLR